LSIRVKVPGKLILLGEYAVLEGANALVASVDRFVHATISASKHDYCQLFSSLTSDPIRILINRKGEFVPDHGQSDELIKTMQFSLLIINELSKKIRESGLLIKPFDLQIDTSQFYIEANTMKLGLGSSAALTVSIIFAISCFLSIEDDLFSNDYDLFRFACDTHFKAQGNRGSGIDIAASVFGGINIYNVISIDRDGENQEISTISVAEDLYILPVWTGVSASTRELLSQVDKFRGDFEKEYQDMMSRLMVLSETGCVIYKEKNCSDFLDIVQDYYKVLKDFSSRSKIPIISNIHENIAEIVSSTGGVYKPSGAGGGDIGLAFSDSKEVIDNVKKALMEKNIEILSLGVSEQGIHIDTTKN
jgi:phosphomevalonate kinase